MSGDVSTPEDQIHKIFMDICDKTPDDVEFPDAVPSWTEPERFVFWIQYFDTEVNNGGFEQFLRNPAGMYAVETQNALVKINAMFSADLLDQALSLFDGHRPHLDQQVRNQQLDRIAPPHNRGIYVRIDALSQLDDKYYRKTEDVFQLLLRYWNENS